MWGQGFVKVMATSTVASQTPIAPECATKRLSIDSQCQTSCQGKAEWAWGPGGREGLRSLLPFSCMKPGGIRSLFGVSMSSSVHASFHHIPIHPEWPWRWTLVVSHWVLWLGRLANWLDMRLPLKPMSQCLRSRRRFAYGLINMYLKSSGTATAHNSCWLSFWFLSTHIVFLPQMKMLIVHWMISNKFPLPRVLLFTPPPA